MLRVLIERTEDQQQTFFVHLALLLVETQGSNDPFLDILKTPFLVS